MRGVKPSGDPHLAAREHSGKGSRSARDRCLWVSGSSADHARAAPVETEKGGIEMKTAAGYTRVTVWLLAVVTSLVLAPAGIAWAQPPETFREVSTQRVGPMS